MAFIEREAFEASAELAEIRGPFPNFTGFHLRQAGRQAPAQRHAHHHRPHGHDLDHRGLLLGHRAALLAGLRAPRAGRHRDARDQPGLRDAGPRKGLLLRRSHAPARQRRRPRRRSTQVPEDMRRVFVTAHDITPESMSRCRRPSRRTPTTPSPRPSTSPNPPRAEEVAEVFTARLPARLQGRDHLPRQQPRGPGPLHQERAQNRPRSGCRNREEPAPAQAQEARTPAGADRQDLPDEDRLRPPLHHHQRRRSTASSKSSPPWARPGAARRANARRWAGWSPWPGAPGVDVDSVVRNLRGISCHKPSGFGASRVLSCADALALAVQSHYSPSGSRKARLPGGGLPGMRRRRGTRGRVPLVPQLRLLGMRLGIADKLRLFSD